MEGTLMNSRHLQAELNATNVNHVSLFERGT